MREYIEDGSVFDSVVKRLPAGSPNFVTKHVVSVMEVIPPGRELRSTLPAGTKIELQSGFFSGIGDPDLLYFKTEDGRFIFLGVSDVVDALNNGDLKRIDRRKKTSVDSYSTVLGLRRAKEIIGTLNKVFADTNRSIFGRKRKINLTENPHFRDTDFISGQIRILVFRAANVIAKNQKLPDGLSARHATTTAQRIIASLPPSRDQ